MGKLGRWGIYAAIATLIVSNAVCLAIICAGAVGEGPGPRVQSMQLLKDRKGNNLQIRTVFSEDMVTPRETGALLNSQPVIFEPRLQGSFAWQDPRTLLFRVTRAPTLANLKARVDVRLTDAVGRAMRGMTEFVLTAPRLEVLGATQKGLAADGCPVLELSFSDDVVPSALQHFLELRFANRREAESGFSVLGSSASRELKIAMSRAGAGALQVTVRAGLSGVSLSPLAENAVRTVTVEAMLILQNLSTEQVDGGYFRVELAFNGTVGESALDSGMEISPKVTAIAKNPRGTSGFTARFEPGKAYTLTLRKGLKSIDGLVLAEDITRHVIFPDLAPDITLSGEGFYLPSHADQRIPIRTINARELSVELTRLYANNVVPFVREGPSWYGADRTSRALPEHKLAINAKWNEWVETSVDLPSVIGAPARGTYCLSATINERRYDRVHAILQVTDLGITAKQAPSSFLVWVTSLATAAPVAGAKVSVVSSTNQTVFQGLTDARGLVAFDGEVPNADKEPAYVVTAELGEDLAFLDLSRTRIEATEDLPAAAPYLGKGYEAYVWTERGVYRPEEEVNIYTIVRDRQMRAPSAAFPVRFRIVKPDGRLWQTLKGMLSEAATAHLAFSVPAYMALGNYRIEVLGAADEVLGQHTVLLEEVRPDRMRVRVQTAPERLAAGIPATAVVSAFHLFGQAAAGLSAKGMLKLDTASFAPAKFKNYRFAPFERRHDLPERTILLGEQVLDSEGTAKFETVLPAAPLPAERFSARFSFTVSEKGGRSVTETVVRTVDPYPAYLGITRATPDPQSDRETYFGIVALTPDAAPAPLGSVVANVVERIWRYGYEQEQGQWHWSSHMEERPAGTFTVPLAAGKGELVFTTPKAGDYVVKLESAQTLHRTSLHFYVQGPHWSPCSFMNPAAAGITAAEKKFAPGADAALTVMSPFDGTLLLSVEGDRVHHSSVLPVVRGANKVSVPVNDALWPNAYVVAQIVRPYWSAEVLASMGRAKPADKAVPAVGPEQGAPVKAIAPAEQPGGATQDTPQTPAAPVPSATSGGTAAAPEDAVADEAEDANAQYDEESEDESEEEDMGEEEADTLASDAAVLGDAVDAPVTPAAGGALDTPAAPTPAAQDEPLPARFPYRAFGVFPLRLDTARRAITIALEAPAKVKPGEEIAVRARTADGQGAPLAAEVVLALVDEGLLSLTAEPVPDPLASFAALRALECETSDVFSYLVPNRRLAPGGSDAGPGAGLAKRRLNPIQYEAEKPVVFFYGPRPTNAAGELELKLPAPDFAGELRLVALAVTADRTGAAKSGVIVKPDLVMRTSYPRLLAPGDRAEVPVVFFNNEEKERKLALSVVAEGPVKVEGASEVTLPAGKEAVVKLALLAGDACGTARIAVRVAGEGFLKEEKTELPVRPPWASASVYASGVIAADGAAHVVPGPDTPKLPAFYADTAEGAIVLSPSPLAEFAGAARYLVAYPYGCAEQTTSRMLALSAARKLGMEEVSRNATPLMAAGIRRLASFQTPAGGLGMWAGYMEPYPWVSIFATHVLLTVKKEHELLLGDMLPDLLGYVEGVLNARKEELDVRAYACYVCAAAGRDVAAQALRLAEENLSPAAVKLVASALKTCGEEEGAKRLIARVLTHGAGRSSYFMSPAVQDAMELLAEVNLGRTDHVQPLVKRLTDAARRQGRWGTTHDCAWALLALGAWAESQGLSADKAPRVEIVANGVQIFGGELRTSKELKLTPAQAAQLTCTVQDAPAFFSLTMSGIPTTPVREPAAERFTITRRFHDFAGNKIDGPFALGQAYVVTLGFNSLDTLQNVVVSDLLPGGFEIENGRLASRVDEPTAATTTLVAEHVEMRDDRLLLFLTVPPAHEPQALTYRYVVRAVAAGEFTLPRCVAECMYDPEVRAGVEGGTIRVLAAQ